MSKATKKSRMVFSAVSLFSCTSLIAAGLLQEKALSAPSNLIAEGNNPYVQDYEKKPKAPAVKTPATSAPADTSKSASAAAAGAKPADSKDASAGKDGKAAGTTKSGTTGASTGKKKERILSIVKPTKHTSADATKWQQFADSIVLKPGQEALPLTLTVINGGDGAQPLRAIRGYLSGRLLFSDKSFKGKDTLTLDMTNALTPGETQIVFEVFGAKGAAFNWNLSAKLAPTVTSLSPKQSAAGKVVKGVGKLLPSDVKSYSITVGGKSASVVSASPEAVEFRVPQGLQPGTDGTVPVQFTILGTRQKNVLTLKIAEEPEITRFDHVSIGSQQPLNISGKHFGNDSSVVKVTFNGTPGQVTSCSDSSITVTTPEMDNIPVEATVSVEVNGLKCKQEGKIMFSMRNVDNDEGYLPFDIPQHLK